MARKQEQPKFLQKESKPDYVRYQKPTPVTTNHKLYHKLLKDQSKHFVISDGLAGSGKSITAVYYAVQAVLRGEARGIYFVRANEGIGKDIGYTKGTEIDKLLPILKQLCIYASSFFNDSIENLLFDGRIVLQSLNKLQGLDLTGYWLVVDESQLIEPEAMYCILTRGAEKTVIIGDCRPEQSVCKRIKLGKDGLSFLLYYLGDSPSVGTVSMDQEDDIVRQGFLKEVVMKLTGALEEWNKK
jgi:predicted ribonuclease YlaK